LLLIVLDDPVHRVGIFGAIIWLIFTPFFDACPIFLRELGLYENLCVAVGFVVALCVGLQLEVLPTSDLLVPVLGREISLIRRCIACGINLSIVLMYKLAVAAFVSKNAMSELTGPVTCKRVSRTLAQGIMTKGRMDRQTSVKRIRIIDSDCD